MIVECQSCQTRFRLDDAKVPATGAKVRCSRCKTAFTVHRADVTPNEVVEEVVAEATDPGTSHAPAPSQDLAEHAASDASPPGDEPSSESEVDQWEFDEAPGPPAVARSAQEALDEAGADPALTSESTERDDSDLDSIGSPEDWDLLAGAKSLATEARFEAEPPRVVDAPRETPRETPQPAFVERAVAAAAATPAVVRRPRVAWGETLTDAAQGALQGGAWLAAGVLCAAGIALAVTPSSFGAPPPSGVVTASYGGKPVEVRIRRLENATGGVIVVAGGQLPEVPAPSGPGLMRLTWLDESGSPLTSAFAGPPLPDRTLRELSIERLSDEYTASARRWGAGGGFEAAFAGLPAGASSISITREPVPVLAGPATQQDGGAAATTVSSLPSARPSSE